MFQMGQTSSDPSAGEVQGESGKIIGWNSGGGGGGGG